MDKGSGGGRDDYVLLFGEEGSRIFLVPAESEAVRGRPTVALSQIYFAQG